MKKMTKDNDAVQRSGRRDKPARTTPSAAKLKQIFGDSPTLRNLTPYEIDLLRKSKQEMAQGLREGLVGKMVNGDVIIEI